MGLSYVVGIPSGEMREFIDQTSFLGFGIEGRQFINENVAFGVTFNWSKFRETESVREVNRIDNQEHLIDTFPLLLNIDYYFLSEIATFRPFTGINTGIFFINRRDLTARGIFQDKNWHFGFAPEAGFMLELFYDLNLMMIARYNLPLASSSAYQYYYWSLHFTFVSIRIY